MRDVFLTCRSFFKRISDFVKYRTATRDMNERYADATAEEIAREDTCIICREEMRPYPLVDGANGAPEQAARNPVAERMRPKKLPCGHVLHFACLRSWLERQQICPTCRQPVVPSGRPPPVGAVQAAANPAVGQPPAAVPGQPAMDQANQGDAQPPEGQNRFRMLNLGPLRIGFGAGRGDLVNDLAQQINDHARPVQAGNQDHARQYGFGFGFGRQRAPPATRTGTANIHTQLNTIEQRLQQEISELRMAANELHVVRNLEAELTRLRTLRQAAIGHPVPGPTTLLQAPPSGIVPPVSIRPAQALVANPLQPILSSGSDALPEGLTLPHGWTMMPLQRIDGMGHPAPPTTTNSASAPVNPQILSAQGRPPSAHAPSPIPISQPPVTTGIGVAGPSLTSSLNIGQTRRRDGASDVPNSTMPTPLLGSALTNGERILPNMGSSGEPAVTSSAGTPNTTPTANQNREDPSIVLPSLPTWGSSVLLAAPVASRPSAPSRNGEAFTDGESTSDGLATAKDTLARPPTENGINHDEQEGGTASPSSSKGKSKAATVEDFIEDVD
jgi:E3 ubiquitin-protein ligase synoviolin